ncbi:ABC transporter substrate-binding protein [Shewanella waksmanii]|uniref:ABC transporter substrate-binding protein n=1 Tax=Shewanella waksmanii TaxID=213783 RepID=UPI003736087E
MRTTSLGKSALIILVSAALSKTCVSETASAQWWLKNELTPSTLSYQQQLEEMQWFINAATPYKGMEIRVVSERIATHQYEATVLAKAFYEITGIHVVHELTGEDDVIKKLSAQIMTGQNLYDAYINDSDLIGTHFRSGDVVALSDFMQKQGKDVTLPSLDLADFIGIKFTTAPDGKLYQLPDQQFANLYWYRHDWFSTPKYQQDFKRLYGYELAVPQNWQAYEDIAEFFSEHVKRIDGQRIYGHMDYAKTDPSLGWRMSDAWLSMAGVGDKGLPNGLPVDEWGIRVEECRPVGASVSRGGALNGPAAVYAIDKYVEWLNRFAPPESKQLNFTQAGEWPGKGVIAQQIFWYTAFVADLTKPNLSVMNSDGTPKWRIAPSPVGKYWQVGMKSGYQDTGAWTLLHNTPIDRQKAAWLYAQFVVSKTVSLKKTLVGLTPIRKSDIDSQAMTQRAPYLGGLVEFYRSRGRDVWTPTGTNVPDYPHLAKYWWQHISRIVEGQISTQQGLDEFAEKVDQHLMRLSANNHPCSPRLNAQKPDEYWLNQAGAPKPSNTAPVSGRTLPYDEAINVWR